MLNQISADDLLYVDIETIPATASLSDLTPEMQALWDRKSESFRKPEQTAADVYQRAGIYAEFGRIICISAGLIYRTPDGRRGFRTKSFASDDERALLDDFGRMLDGFCQPTRPERMLCGHNIKEFDVPYIARRMLINCVGLPGVIDVAGRKPWEVRMVDTMELWKFGDYKSFTSLNLLTHIFGIPTPKDDIDGSQVAEVYYGTHDIARIAVYCEKDVLATAQLLLRYKGEPLIDTALVEHVN